MRTIFIIFFLPVFWGFMDMELFAVQDDWLNGLSKISQTSSIFVIFMPIISTIRCCFVASLKTKYQLFLLCMIASILQGSVHTIQQRVAINGKQNVDIVHSFIRRLPVGSLTSPTKSFEKRRTIIGKYPTWLWLPCQSGWCMRQNSLYCQETVTK